MYVVRFKCFILKSIIHFTLRCLYCFICPTFWGFILFLFIHCVFYFNLSTLFKNYCLWVNSLVQEFLFICSGYIEVLYWYRNSLSFPLLEMKVYFKSWIEDPVCIAYLQITVRGILYTIYIYEILWKRYSYLISWFKWWHIAAVNRFKTSAWLSLFSPNFTLSVHTLHRFGLLVFLFCH